MLHKLGSIRPTLCLSHLPSQRCVACSVAHRVAPAAGAKCKLSRRAFLPLALRSATMTSSNSTQAPEGLDAERVSRNLALHLAAEAGDVDEVKKLLDEGADVWWEDEDTIGWSALHFAAEGGHTKLVKLLLRRGALWNAVDQRGITAAEIAWSLNDDKTYQAILEEGVRQTVIRNLLDQQNREQSMDLDEDDAAPQVSDGNVVLKPDAGGEVAVSNKAFLASKLTFEKGEDGQDRCIDVDGGVVMAAWETDIMKRTAELLCADQPEGFSVLNVGFGLGIIDTFIQSHKPGRHVIIEPHPDVLAYMRAQGWDKKPGVEIWDRRWQDCLNDPALGDFDAVYTDTYSEDYAALREFFEELPNLLSGPAARFSFFHGLAGTNPFLYDVYTRLAEVELRGIGLLTEWEDIRPQTTEATWKGTRRAYWSLDTFRIPLSKMDII